MGKAARARVLSDYQWDRNLATVDALLGDSPAPVQPLASVAPAVAGVRTVRS